MPVAALALLVAAAGPALATETATTGEDRVPVLQEHDPSDFAEAADQLPEPLQEAVRRDLGLDPAQYLAAAEHARDAADVVARTEGVTSAWIAEDGRLHVVAEDDAARAEAEARGAVVDRVGSDPLADAVTSARSQTAVATAWADRQADAVVVREHAVLTGAPATAQVADPTPDPTGSPADGALDRPAEAPAGGRPLTSTDDDTAYRCTTGPLGSDADGRALAPTTAACARGPLAGRVGTLPTGPLLDASWPNAVGALPDLGAVDGDSVRRGAPDPEAHRGRPGGDDAALVALDAELPDTPVVRSWATPSPDDTVSATDPPTADDEAPPTDLVVRDAIAPLPGAPACVSSPGAGWQCAPVLATATTTVVDDAAVTGLLLAACTTPGDAGSPVVVGPYVAGIVTASTAEGCEGWSADDDLTLAYPVLGADHSLEARYGDGFDTAIAVDAPDLDEPSVGTATGPTPTFTGHLDGAPGTTVTIEIDGAEPLTTTTGADGRFTAVQPDPLPVGSHGFLVTASHTAVGASTVTTSEPVGGRFEVADTATALLTVASPLADQVADDDRPAFSGQGQPGAAITLLVDGNPIADATVDDDGRWTARPSDALPAGRYDAVVRQEVGSEAETSSVQLTGLGVTPAAPELTQVRPDGESLMASGSGVPGAEVTVEIGGTVHSATVDRDGAFEIEAVAPPPGDYRAVARQSVDTLSSGTATLPVAVDAPRARRTTTGAGPEGGGSTLWIWLLGLAAVLGAGLVPIAWRSRHSG